MKIKVLSIRLLEPENWEIQFETQIGTARGEWRGHEPVLSKEYFVEFEIPEPLQIQSGITISNVNKFGLGTGEDGIYFIGKLESQDEDGFTTLRLGENILCFETPDILAPWAKEGEYLKISTPKVLVYDIEV